MFKNGETFAAVVNPPHSPKMPRSQVNPYVEHPQFSKFKLQDAALCTETEAASLIRARRVVRRSNITHSPSIDAYTIISLDNLRESIESISASAFAHAVKLRAPQSVSEARGAMLSKIDEIKRYWSKNQLRFTPDVEESTTEGDDETSSSSSGSNDACKRMRIDFILT
jgi:hypothetical protein